MRFRETVCSCHGKEGLFDLMGHTPTGHRIALLLARNGITTAQQLLDCPDEELVTMRTMGAGTMDHVHDVIEHCDRWPSYTPAERKALYSGMSGKYELSRAR